MQQTGEYRIAAPAAEVWRALNDPEVLARCIPGCESLERTGETSFRAKVRAKVGPVSAAFEGEVTLSDLDPPRAYTLNASAKGGAAGFGRGTARVTLEDQGAETVLRYSVEGSVGGKLAQIGQRLIDAAARKTADDFFAAFAEAVAPAPAPAARAPQTPAQRVGLAHGRQLAWLVVAAVAFAVIVAAVAYLR
jgi:carbon monoxide dehydrogenase subunit G